MMTGQKSKPISYGKIIFCAAVFFFVLMFLYRLSENIGGDTSAECGWAISVMLLSWLLSSTLYLLADIGKLKNFVIMFLVSSAVRIILIGACMAAVLKFCELQRNMFLMWAVIVYVLLLLTDTLLSVKYLKSVCRTQKDFFSDNKNEIDIGHSQSARRSGE